MKPFIKTNSSIFLFMVINTLRLLLLELLLVLLLDESILNLRQICVLDFGVKILKIQLSLNK